MRKIYSEGTFGFRTKFINNDSYFCYRYGDKATIYSVLEDDITFEINLDKNIPRNSNIYWIENQLVFLSPDKGIVAYDIQTGKRDYPLTNVPKELVQFWNVGDKILFLHKNRLITCWDLTSGLNFYNYQNSNTLTETEVHILTKSNKLIIGDMNGLLKVINIETGGDTILVSDKNLGQIMSINSSEDENHFLVGFGNGEIRIWNSESLGQVQILKGSDLRVRSVEFITNTKLHLVIAHDSILSNFEFDLKLNEISKTEIEDILNKRIYIRTLQRDDYKYLLTSTRDYTIIYDIFNQKLHKKVTHEGTFGIGTLFSKDFDYVFENPYQSSWDEGKPMVKFYNLSNNEIEKFNIAPKYNGFDPVRFSDDNNYVILKNTSYGGNGQYYRLDRISKSIGKIKNDSLVYIGNDNVQACYSKGEIVVTNPFLSSINSSIPVKKTKLYSLIKPKYRTEKKLQETLLSALTDITFFNERYVKLTYGFFGMTSELFDLVKKTSVYDIDRYQTGEREDYKVSPNGKIFIKYQDNRIEFWDLSDTLKHLVDLHFITATDWLVSDSKGLFDSSPKAMRDAYFVVGNEEIVEFEQLKSRYYEPHLLQKKLGYNDERIREIEGIKGVSLYPDMKITHPDDNNGNLGITLVDRGGGIGRVQIKINDKEVTYDARGNLISNNDSLLINYKITDHPYLKSDGVNKISVRVFNKEGYLSSRWKNMYYLAKEVSQEEIPPALFGIIIGTSEYHGDDLDLKYASKDAQEFAKALILVGEKLFGRDYVNVKLLNTDVDAELLPTKENIYSQFKDFGSKANPKDVLVVYLSGHGVNYGGDNADFYYLTMDANSGNLTDPVIRENVSISSGEFIELIKGIPALKQVMIIDACHSGRLAEDIMVSRSDRPSSEIRALERLKDRTGTYVLAGSAADAVSYEASIYGQGLLTYSLLFGMKGASLRENKFVDVMQLFQFAADKVPDLAKAIGGIQKPEIRVPYEAQSFDIGIVDELIRDQINLPSPKPLFVRSNFMNAESFADDLRLTDAINEQLNDFSASRKGEPKLVFIDVARFSDAYSLKGQYTLNNDNIKLVFRLFMGEEILETFNIEVKNKDILLKEIVVKSMEFIDERK